MRDSTPRRPAPLVPAAAAPAGLASPGPRGVLPRRTARDGLAVLAGVAARAGLAAFGWLAACTCSGADGSFGAAVSRPAHVSTHPRIVVDEAHENDQTAEGRYAPFARLAESDGYEVVRGRARITKESLDGVSVLVIAAAMGTGERGDDPALDSDEGRAVEAWVRGGGGLLLIVDHYPFGSAVQPLASLFGVEIRPGFAQDGRNHAEGSGDLGRLVFSRANGLLADHPITAGRSEEERVGVERSWWATRVHVTYGPPRPAAGRAQGLALEHGGGRVVVLGEAAMLTAQVDGGRPIGMNAPGNDNRRLALDVLHWLSRLL